MFRVLFENNKESKWVYFSVYNTEIAQKWYQELSNDYEIHENTRLTDWPGQNLSLIHI